MTTKRRRGRKWAMLEAVATAMVHGWKLLGMWPHCAILERNDHGRAIMVHVGGKVTTY